MGVPFNKVKREIFGTEYEFETGRLAKLASGAVLARSGETIVLAAVVAESEPAESEGFLPLTVNYQEKTYAAGKIPGGYLKREGRPSNIEVLTSRLIDRPIRPLIPKSFNFPMQIIITVISADLEHDPGVLSLTAASAALMTTDVPFDGPLAGVRIGRIDGELICNPTRTQLELSDMNIVVAGTREAIVMVEGEASEVPEAEMVDALVFAQSSLIPFIEIQEELISGVDIVKREVPEPEEDHALTEDVLTLAGARLREAVSTHSKVERRALTKEVVNDTIAQLSEKYTGQEKKIEDALDKLKKEIVRGIVVNEKVRLDGRGYTDIREITCDVGPLPRTHGSAIFTRGETQALVVATLGTSYDEQRVDALEGEYKKRFMLHYNFPPYCVGETSFRLGPGRREIGHGNLAERSIIGMLPNEEEFPYAIRIVSDILESNGSSSMATVCGATLSLMDAGVPIKAPVGGIAMGLIKEGDEFVILSDILGDEDQLGDMDFKVTGTEKGVTALQMDIKVTGVTREILSQALGQAREGRLFVLGKMAEAISEPRADISQYAPKIVTVTVKKDKIKDVIGPGGKMIKKIIEVTGASIDINDDGTVNIASPNAEACEKAKAMIADIVREAEPGKIYLGTVKRVLDFGAIVELFNGTDGLVHISELEHKRVATVTDVLNEGDEVLVKCLRVDRDGKIRLSRKEALGENIEDYRN